MKAVLSIGTIYLVCSSDTLAQTAHEKPLAPSGCQRLFMRGFRFRVGLMK